MLLDEVRTMVAQVAPPQTETRVTGEELQAMGDIGPSELVEGRVVTMSPTGGPHAVYESNFDEYLKAFCAATTLGQSHGR